jgi:hypothetical protein
MYKLLSILFFLAPCVAFSQIGDVQPDSLFFIVEGTVNDEETKILLEGSKVKLIGTDGSSTETLTDSNGYYSFDLNYPISYSIVASKKKYYVGKGKITTQNLSKSKTLISSFELKQIENIGCPLFPNILFEQNKVIPFFEENNSNDLYELFLGLLKENPSIIIELTGYRDKTEKKKISLYRAQKLVSELNKRGINKLRLPIVDGGIRNYLSDSNYTSKRDKNWSKNRTLHFKIIGDNFKP